MVETSRLARLPGYDTAPDVYETPELTDDTSTTRQTSADSASASETASSDEEDEDSHGLSRRHLSASAARARFTGTGKGVEVKAGDFGDRLGVRKGYRVRRREAGEEEESLEQRIARLRREVEECRVLAREEGGEDDEEAEEGGEDVLGETEVLKKVLEGLEGSRVRRQVRRAEPALELAKGNTQANGDVDENTLGKVADFDSRLASLERSLGLSSLDAASTEAVAHPILPSLALLDQQLNALMTASSVTNLEAASARIRQLREEAEQTPFVSTEPSQNGAATGTSTPSSEAPPALPGLSAVDLQKLQDLHSLLPNLQSLSPSVPALLDRLRSLRTLHAGAANASAELEHLEKRQGEFDKELKEWRDGLGRVESAMKTTDEANGRNGKVVQGWVKDLEGRMKALSSGR